MRYLPDLPVTNEFSNLLHTTISGGTINQNLYDSLSDDEKNTFDLLVSNDISTHKRHNQSEINQLINRYNVVKGEILIGNDNPLLLKELKAVILKLVSLNVISIRDISDLLSNIYLFSNNI